MNHIRPIATFIYYSRTATLYMTEMTGLCNMPFLEIIVIFNVINWLRRREQSPSLDGD